MIAWYQVKLFLQHASGFSMDALHVVLGVALQLLAALLLRSSVARWTPWLIVAVIALINEANDLLVEQWPQPAVQYGESGRDMVLTLALPTLLLFSARRCPRLFAAR